VTSSGEDPRLWVLYVAVVGVAAFAAAPTTRAAARTFRWPPPAAAVVLWATVTAASVARLIAPDLLDVLDRRPVRTRDSGEWWRVLTAGVVEDGGVLLTVANLVLLAIVAVAAVRSWGWYRAVGLFVLGQILWGLFTTFVVPSVGAGTTGATLALAGSLAGLWPIVGASRPQVIASVATFLLGAVLVALGDAHGVAVLIGMLLGAVLGTVLPPLRPAHTGTGEDRPAHPHPELQAPPPGTPRRDMGS